MSDYEASTAGRAWYAGSVVGLHLLSSGFRSCGCIQALRFSRICILKSSPDSPLSMQASSARDQWAIGLNLVWPHAAVEARIRPKAGDPGKHATPPGGAQGGSSFGPPPAREASPVPVPPATPTAFIRSSSSSIVVHRESKTTISLAACRRKINREAGSLRSSARISTRQLGSVASSTTVTRGQPAAMAAAASAGSATETPPMSGRVRIPARTSLNNGLGETTRMSIVGPVRTGISASTPTPLSA